MKLRIRGNSIRLRLTQSEIEQIKDKASTEERTEFPNGQSFVYALSIGEKFSADFTNGKMEIFIPEITAQNWTNSDEVGIYGSVGEIQISIEKDFKCLNPRAGEEDADTFPHPKEHC